MTQSPEVTTVAPAPTQSGGWTPKLVTRIILLILVGEIGFMTYALPTGVLAPIAAQYQTDQVVWVVAAYAITSAACAPFLGRLADKIGKKKVLMIMLAGGIIGGFVVAFAPTFGVVVIGRALQGLSLGLPFILASLVRDVFPSRVLSLATALVVTGSGILSIIISLATSPIIANFGWQGVFWVPAVYAVVVGIIVIIFVPESSVRARGGSLDILGAVLLAGAVACLLVPISLGESWGWTSPISLALFGIGVVLAVAWVIQALHAKSPVIALRDFAHPPLLMTVLISFIGLQTVIAIYQFWSYVIATPAEAGLGYGLGLQPQDISLFAAIFSLGSFIGGFISGRLLRTLPAGSVVMGMFALSTVAYIVAAFSLSSAVAFGICVFAMSLSGGTAFSCYYNLVAQIVPAVRQASTASAVNVGMNIGAAIFPVIMFAIINSASVHVDGAPVYTVDWIRFAFLVPAAINALCIIPGGFLLRYQKRHGTLALRGN